MGETTAISWTDHTFNPWMGCSKVSSACDNCYAEALGKRTGRVQWGDDAERVVTSDGYWRNPVKWNAQAEAEGRRHRVFCASMADVFEDRDGLEPHRDRLFDLIMFETPWLDWQLLTKRPENVLRMVPPRWLDARAYYGTDGWPDNAWIGCTVEDQERADERIPALLAIPARVQFLSCEPLLGAVTLKAHWLRPTFPGPRIDWIICGGESGPRHRPLNLDHARSLRDQCVAAGVPYFFKQVGGRTPKAGGDLLDGVAWKQFPTVTTDTTAP